MTLRRRDLLKFAVAWSVAAFGSSNLARPAAALGGLLPSSRSGHNGGKGQICIGVRVPSQELPFLNVCKSFLTPYFAVSATEDYNLLLNSRGYPTRLATGAGSYWRSAAESYIYGTTGDVWVMDWQGSATLTLFDVNGGGFNQTLSSANRNEYTLTGAGASPLRVYVKISAMAANNFDTGQIRVYLKKYETLINSGAIFDPDFLQRVQNFGVIRVIDWMGQTQQLNTSLWSQNKTLDDASWFGGKIDSTLWCGTASMTNNAMTVNQPSAPIASWTDGQIVQFNMPPPTFKTVTAGVAGNPTALTCVGHGFTTGDTVEFQPNTANGAWGIGLTVLNALGGPLAFTATVIDADHFSIPYDTTSAGALPSNRVVYKQITLAVGALPPVACSRQGLLNYRGDIWSVSTVPEIAFYNAAYNRLMMPGSADTVMPAYMQSGPPPEVIAQLANTTGAHPWMNISLISKDSYVSSLAAFLRDNLGAALVPRLAIGNEVWNANYWGAQFYNQLGLVEPAFLTGPLARAGSQQEYYGYRSKQCADLATAAYSGSGKAFKWMLEMQGNGFASNAYSTGAMKCPPSSGYVSAGVPGNTSKYPSASCQIAYAAYFVPAFFNKANAQNYAGYVAAVSGWKDGSAVQAAYDFWYNALYDNTGDVAFPTLQPVRYWAETAGPAWIAIGAAALPAPVEVHQYEGGESLTAISFITLNWTNPTGITTTDVQNCLFDFFANAQQYYNLLYTHMQGQSALGIKFPAQYCVASVSAAGGFWGVINMKNLWNWVAGTGYKGLVAWNAPP